MLPVMAIVAQSVKCPSVTGKTNKLKMDWHCMYKMYDDNRKCKYADFDMMTVNTQKV